MLDCVVVAGDLAVELAGIDYPADAVGPQTDFEAMVEGLETAAADRMGYADGSPGAS